MIASINYNVCMNRSGYVGRKGTRQVVIELYQQGCRRVINTHVHVAATDFAYGLVQPSNPDYDLLNRKIRRIVRHLMELEDELLEHDIPPTPQRVAEAYLHHQTTTATISQWISEVVGKSRRCEGTKRLYRALCNSLNDFQPDIRLGDLSHDMIERWQYWMHHERQLSDNTISCRLKMLRCLVSEAIKRDVIRAESDPFRHIRIPEITARREHLSEEELDILERATLSSDRLCHVRDAFLFCCYTGLRWSDFCRLTSANLVAMQPKGETALSIRQHKTGQPLCIPVSVLWQGRALGIVRKYGTLERLSAIGNNRNANQQLRLVAAEAGLSRHMHWHLARHTCGTLLNQRGLRMQEIQFVLGHSKQETTERHYAETLYQQVAHSLSTAFSDITN